MGALKPFAVGLAVIFLTGCGDKLIEDENLPSQDAVFEAWQDLARIAKEHDIGRNALTFPNDGPRHSTGRQTLPDRTEPFSQTLMTVYRPETGFQRGFDIQSSILNAGWPPTLRLSGKNRSQWYSVFARRPSNRPDTEYVYDQFRLAAVSKMAALFFLMDDEPKQEKRIYLEYATETFDRAMYLRTTGQAQELFGLAVWCGVGACHIRLLESRTPSEEGSWAAPHQDFLPSRRQQVVFSRDEVPAKDEVSAKRVSRNAPRRSGQASIRGMRTGITYWTSADWNCSPSADRGCLDLAAVQALCAARPSTPVNFSNLQSELRQSAVLTNSFDSVTLLRNRNIENDSFSYSHQRSRCLYSITLAGIVDGTSIRRSHLFEVLAYRKAPNGEVSAVFFEDTIVSDLRAASGRR